MHPMLRLTAEERRFNDLYDMPDGRRGVIERRYAYQVRLTSSNPLPQAIHRASRRSRVFQLTFSGYLQGVALQIKSATGELYTQEPVHLPLLCGASPRDPTSVHPVLVPVNFPQTVNTQYSTYPARLWAYVIDPNIVLPGSRELQLAFSPMLQNDPVLSTDGYNVGVVVHSWEFPGFQGGAL